MSTPESDVIDEIGEYLTLKRHFFYRSHNNAVYDTAKKVMRRMPKFSKYGVADFTLVFKGTPYYIEAKSEKGVQSERQKKFQAECEAAGSIYILARSHLDLIKAGL